MQMMIDYDMGVPKDWSYKAKDYFIMGRDPAGMSVSGISSELVELASQIVAPPRWANESWKFVVAHVLNRMALNDSAWEDLRVKVQGLPGKEIALEFFIPFENNDDVVRQPIVRIQLNPKKDIEDKDPRPFKTMEQQLGPNGLLKEVDTLDPLIAQPLDILGRYISPSYRKVKQTNTEALLHIGQKEYIVKRTIYDHVKEFGNPDIVETQWEIKVVTWPLSKTFKDHYVPVGFTEEEAELFFGPALSRSPWQIVVGITKSMASSIRGLFGHK